MINSSDAFCVPFGCDPFCVALFVADQFSLPEEEKPMSSQRLCTMAVMAAVLNVACVSAAEQASPKLQPPHGILFVDNTCNHPAKGGDLFSYKNIDGITEYFPWKRLEPKDGVYEFSAVTSLLAEAKASGKKVAFGVLAGVHVPAWYVDRYPTHAYRYSRCPAACEYPPQPAVKTACTAVLPWLKTNGGAKAPYEMNAVFFDRFLRMISLLAREIDARELGDTVLYVAITGPGVENGLEVQLPIVLYEDWERADFNVETKRILIESWVLCAGTFKACFPHTSLTIAVADNFGGRPDSSAGNIQEAHDASIGKAVLEGIMAAETPQCQQVFPMGLWYSDWNRWDGSLPLCNVLMEWRRKGYRIGAQAHRMAHDDVSSLEKTVGSAREANASWLELWYHDMYLDGFDRVPEEYGR
jgi:hypothetical protein